MGDSSRSDAVSVGEGVKPHLSKKTIVLGVLSLVLTIILCLAAIYYKDYLISAKYVAQYGLLGMLIVAFLGGSLLSMIAIPVPYWLLVFTLPSVLAPQMKVAAPIAVGIASGIGAGLGQSLTFMIGYGSRDLSQQLAFTFNKRLYVRAVEWAQRRGSMAVFLMSAIINPLHLPMTLAMASLHFPAWKFILYSLLGNIVKSSFIAFCGYFGLTSLFKVLGI
jgi:membrane protein DedA with SNARE-associated domain